MVELVKVDFANEHTDWELLFSQLFDECLVQQMYCIRKFTATPKDFVRKQNVLEVVIRW